MKSIIHFSLFTILNLPIFAQVNTVGLIHHTDHVTEGYTLLSPERNNKSYLLNNCGEVVNEWTFTERPGLTAYLLENGNILYAGKDSLEIRDWDNGLVWSIAINETFGFNQHHDIEPLPNGNILMVVGDNYDSSAMFLQGLDPNFGSATYRLDKIVEIEPNAGSGGTIVWEWKFYDHLIQDIDSTLPNYGIVDDHPELLNMNYLAESESDFTHVNAVDYNPSLDQIMISARHTNEIYIIDHSTTMQEAASHSGGNAGKGGDFLWRWGNPRVYHSSFTSADQSLNKQHDCKWIDDGQYAGKVSIFSNDYVQNGLNSEVIIIDPVFNNSYAMSSNQFEPINKLWSWHGSILGEPMHAAIKSGVQILPNGNALIMETTKGRVSEIDSTGNLIWVYEIPVGTEIFDQFEQPQNNGAFRATKYPLSYPAFTGRDLTPIGIIEDQNSLSSICQTTLTVEPLNTFKTVVYPNPTTQHINIQANNQISMIVLTNLAGKIIYSTNTSNQIDLSLYPNGLYFLEIENSNNQKSTHKIVKQ